ncbi:MAG: preprotein translocase subunit SecA, partial [Clostridia bacterium]|nr:preprotein translocase subunit SecA [Clostridia bacterium]
RHESRRIDNQLRGRSGRQGDPGASRFYVSLEDDLMRLFGSEKILGLVETLGMDDEMNIEHSLLSKSIENAQKKVEGRNFDIRKHVLQYDNVMNKQREVIYSQRRKVLMGDSIKDNVIEMIKDIVSSAVATYTVGSEYPEEWDLKGLGEFLHTIYLPKNSINQEKLLSFTREELAEELEKIAFDIYEKQEREFGEESIRELERVILLKVVDTKWIDHLDAMDQLREGIGLRAYGQQDPVRAYQMEGYDMFMELINSIKEDTVRYVLNAKVGNLPEREQVAEVITTNQEGGVKVPVVNKEEKTGRNDQCPCGSGKKYKKCCGAE